MLTLWITLTKLAFLNMSHRCFGWSVQSVRIVNHHVRVGDIRIAYRLFIDIFIKEQYRFESCSNSPSIIDGGSHIGLSILFFKLLYPSCTIVGFEPHKPTFDILSHNMRNWQFKNVTIHNVALSDSTGKRQFISDHQAGGWSSHIAWTASSTVELVHTVSLNQFIWSRVDFLKIDIEGEEELVIRDLSAHGNLVHIVSMAVEVHDEPDLPRARNSVGRIVNILAENGYRYIVGTLPDLYWGRMSSPSTKSFVPNRCQLMILATTMDSEKANGVSVGNVGR
jgi:FkbM family methyltransferase